MPDFTQPNSDQAVLKGSEFFRLNTLLSCPGDIYESKQSGRAFAIGPDSDIANVMMTYFDENKSTFVSQMLITGQRPWNGVINARNEASYMPADRPGRILLYSADLYNPEYVPAAFGVGCTLATITPRLDVIEYFQDTETTVGRSDRNYQFQELALPVNFAFIVLPYYGRKSASIRLKNLTTGNVDYSIFGVNYYVNDAGLAVEKQIVAVTTIATGVEALKVVKESVDGMFDALYVSVKAATPDGPTPLNITTSDTAL